MKKRIVCLVLLICVAFVMTVPTFAFQDYDRVYTAVDDLGSDLMGQLGQETMPLLADTLKMDLRVDIVSDLEGYSIEDYAELFYDQYDYGYGENRDGVLLMISVIDHGDSVSFDRYTLYGRGRGAEQLASTEVEGLKTALNLYLTGENVDYSTAGNSCTSVVGLVVGTFTTLNEDVETETVAEPEEPVVEAEPAEETEVPEDSGEAGGLAGLLGGNGGTTEEASDLEEIPPATQGGFSGIISGGKVFDRKAGAEVSTTYILDEAGVLKDTQLENLEEKAEKFTEEYQCGIYVVTVPDVGGRDPLRFAEDYYLSHNLGYGPDKSGMMLFVATESRDTNIRTYGNGTVIFTDRALTELEDSYLPMLGENAWNDAFETFVSTAGEYIRYEDEHGVPYEPKNILVRVLIVIFVPLLIAFVVCMIFYSQMKTAKEKQEANDYISRDTFRLTSRNDRFLRTTVTKTKIEKSGGSGGSSVNSRGFGGTSSKKF